MSEEKPGAVRKSVRGVLSEGVYRVGRGLILLIAFLSPLVLAFQSLFWLRDGEWLELPLWRTLEVFGVEWRSVVEIEGWVGVSRLLHWLVQTPTALCPIIAVMMLFLVMALIGRPRKV